MKAAPLKATVAMFDELPQEIRNHIMYLRARGIYKEAMNNARKWGVTERGEYRFIKTVSFLKDMCRSYGLKVSGTRDELLFRLRNHKKTMLDRKLSGALCFGCLSCEYQRFGNTEETMEMHDILTKK
jgi:hypothetical protein